MWSVRSLLPDTPYLPRTIQVRQLVTTEHLLAVDVTKERPLVLNWRANPLWVPKPSDVKRMRTRLEWVSKGDGGGCCPQNDPRFPEGVSICKTV